MIAVADVITSAGDLLLDEDHVRYPVDELIRWSNEAMGAILGRKPSAFSTITVVSLAQGTKQTLPAGSKVLLDVIRNIKADGTTPGRAIRRSDRQQLDDVDPTWHTAKPKSEIRNYTYDDRISDTYYVYPPAVAGTKVELAHAVLPAEIMNITGILQIGLEYKAAVVNYLCYRANSKESEYSNPAAAVAFYQAFEAELGNKTAADMMASPNQAQNSV